MSEPPLRGLRPVRQLAAHELVYDEIKRAIETWVFRPGQYLPPERDLALMLNVSRNTLRQAAIQLQSDGVIEISRGRDGGYLVLDPAVGPDRNAQIRQNPQLITDVWDVHLPVLTLAARAAAERRSERDLDVLKALLARLHEVYDQFVEDPTLETARESHSLDLEFLIALAAASGNNFLVESVIDCRRRLWLAFSTFLTTLDSRNRGTRAAILDAVERQDPDRASTAMARYVQDNRELFENWLRDGPQHQLVMPETTPARRVPSRTEVRISARPSD